MTQDQVRSWWSRNPMSYDADDAIGHEWGSRAFFEEIDARIFHPRVFRLATDAQGRAFGRYVPFDELQGRDVLEVGSGSGIAVQLFAQAGANVTAVDLTDPAVELTRARMTAFGVTATVFQADGEALPFPDASFDLVMSWGVIHHTTNMDAALSEIVRVCRRGGTVVLMLYHRNSLFYVSYKALARFLPLARFVGLSFETARDGGREGLIARHFSRTEVRALLAGAGLDVKVVEPYGQDSELLPLPRRFRQPITDRLPLGFKDRMLRRYGHQLAIVAAKR